MVDAHHVVAVFAMVSSGTASLAGAYAYTRRDEPGGVVRHLLALAQTLLIAQVALGLLLLSADRRTEDELHYAYGTLALAAALSPWLYAPTEPRRRLAWFAVATLLAALLAGRAYMTA